MNGQQDYAPAPDPSPRGYEEVIDWLLKQRRPWWRKPKTLTIAAIALVVLVGSYIGWEYLQDQQLSVLLDSRFSRIEKLERTPSSSGSDVFQRRAEIITEELDAQRTAIR